MVVTSTTIEDLPNEILISILSHFPTLQLLPLTTTSHRIHDLILLILHHRIFEAGALKSHQLLLEAFHTSNRGAGYSTCRALRTAPLSTSTQTQDHTSLAELSSLYTSFRPLKPSSSEGRSTFRAGLADTGGWFLPIPTLPSQATNENDAEGKEGEKEEWVTQDINLESHELFSQLCTRTNLAKTSPRQGLFHSCVGVGEGILRVWRDWLADAAANNTKGEDILWADSKKTVGLKVKVVEREAVPVGPPFRAGEERDVSYTLFYEELLVRTTKLLLMVERSEELESGNEGKLCGLDGLYFVHGFPEMHRQTLIEGTGGWGEGMVRFARSVYGV